MRAYGKSQIDEIKVALSRKVFPTIHKARHPNQSWRGDPLHLQVVSRLYAWALPQSYGVYRRGTERGRTVAQLGSTFVMPREEESKQPRWILSAGQAVRLLKAIQLQSVSALTERGTDEPPSSLTKCNLEAAIAALPQSCQRPLQLLLTNGSVGATLGRLRPEISTDSDATAAVWTRNRLAHVLKRTLRDLKTKLDPLEGESEDPPSLDVP